MTSFWTWLVSLVAAWAIGSLPLGAWWIRRASGRDPRDLNPYLLGVENVFRLLGPPVAAVGFILDVLKGAVAVAIAPSAGAAAVDLGAIRLTRFEPMGFEIGRASCRERV